MVEATAQCETTPRVSEFLEFLDTSYAFYRRAKLSAKLAAFEESDRAAIIHHLQKKKENYAFQIEIGLFLESNDISTLELGAFLDLTKVQGFQKLRLGGNKLSIAHIFLVEEFFKRSVNSFLAELHLDHCKLTNVEAEPLATIIKSSPLLFLLSIHHNNIQNQGMNVILSSLSEISVNKNPTKMELFLSYNPTHDVGSSQIFAEYVKKNPEVRVLDVSAVLAEADNLQNFVQQAILAKHLRRLYISHNNGPPCLLDQIFDLVNVRQYCYGLLNTQIEVLDCRCSNVVNGNRETTITRKMNAFFIGGNPLQLDTTMMMDLCNNVDSLHLCGLAINLHSAQNFNLCRAHVGRLLDIRNCDIEGSTIPFFYEIHNMFTSVVTTNEPNSDSTTLQIESMYLEARTLDKIDVDWTASNCKGVGFFSEAWNARISSKEVILKLVSTHTYEETDAYVHSTCEDMYEEYCKHKQLKGEYFINTYGLVLSYCKHTRTFVCGLLLDYCDIGEVMDKIGDLDQPARIRVLRDIAEAVDSLHKNRVTHNDIHLRNVLLKSNNGNFTAKLSDYGLMKVFHGQDDDCAWRRSRAKDIRHMGYIVGMMFRDGYIDLKPDFIQWFRDWRDSDVYDWSTQVSGCGSKGRMYHKVLVDLITVVSNPNRSERPRMEYVKETLYLASFLCAIDEYIISIF